MATAPCPICQKAIFYNPRYPNDICKNCVGYATDRHKHYLKFYNHTIFKEQLRIKNYELRL